MVKVRPALREYQLDVIHRVESETQRGLRRILLVAPTGAGKTVIGAEKIRRAVAADRRVLFLAHRRELVTQASRKLYDVDVDHGIVQAGFPTRPDAPVQIASVPTLHARAVRGSAMEMPPADVVIIDEAHHARAETYKAITEQYPDAIVIGLTATPCRGDGRGLGNAFETIVQCPDIAALTEMGFLVPARVYAPTRPDLTGVRVQRGDYVERELAERMDRPKLTGDIVSHWLKLGEGRPTIVFASGVNHSAHLCNEFGLNNVVAAHLDGSTPTEERDRILAQLAAGTVKVVCNAMVLTEGFDDPGIGCLVLARPTRALGLYRQMIGRGLRTAPGKTDCIILDHAGAVFEHGLPDEPVEWTLREDRRANAPQQTARKAGTAPALTTCPECHAIRNSGKACTVCGWRPRTKPIAVEVADGDLGRVGRDRKPASAASTPDERRRFYQMMLWLVERRGYKPGWAKHKFNEKFGMWPDWTSPPPIEPDAATLAWVKSRNIAFARGRSQADAAGAGGRAA